MLDIPARHLNRYTEILSVLLRYGLGYMQFSGNLRPMQEENLTFIGVQLRNACAELGPAFIKVGQFASTRSDLLPQPIVQELAKLQDRVHPLSFVRVRRMVEESLHTRLESAYQKFDPVPMAAASIGQVHQAVLHNGEKVAVKVQRPHLRETVQTDLEIFESFVDQIEQRSQWGKRYPLRLLLKEFSKTIKGELDFVDEGRNAEKLAKLCKKNSHILIPKIYWELTKPTLLTMEYISGVPLQQIIGSQNPSYDVHLIGDRLSKALLQQILLGGCFHGDPHPGNILILPEEKISLLDFGITGHLTRTMRGQILSLMTALIRGNSALIMETISQMGIVSAQVDKPAFQAEISALRHKHLQIPSMNLALGESIQDFFNIIFRHGIYIPSEFILVGKTLITLEGILNELDPTISLVEQAKPYSRRLIWGKYALLNLWQRIWRTKETDTTGLPI